MMKSLLLIRKCLLMDIIWGQYILKQRQVQCLSPQKVGVYLANIILWGQHMRDHTTVVTLRSGIYLKALLLAALFACTEVSATDLGVIAKTYPILEQDLIEQIKDKIASKDQNGELDELNQQWLTRSKKYAAAPKGSFLPPAVIPRITLIETKITLKTDLMGFGKVLYPKRTTVNPLKIMRLTYAMCFIDGDEEKQVNWMIKHCTKNPLNKLVLVNGPLEVLSKRTGLRLFFDQGGDLIRRLKITALPAVLSQKGGDLYVEEIPLL